MKIITLLKRVPDTEARILINQSGTGINEEGIKFVINPYDEYAVEEGLLLREKLGEGTVTVVCMGPAAATEQIRTALAMGADDAVHICDPALDGGGDPFIRSAVLARAIAGEGFDVIFCGKQAIDDDMGQVQSILAELLDIPQVNVASTFDISEDRSSATIMRRIEGGDEKIETSLPAIVSCDKGLNEPRYASLPGIMKAKRKPVKTLTLADLGFDAPPGEPRSAIRKWLTQPKGGDCRMIEAEEMKDAVAELVRLLREEAKAI